MPRANRYYFPGHVWHIVILARPWATRHKNIHVQTPRCHKKEFLLKFVRDRERWLAWLFEAKKRFGLCILNYVVTSNHIHLLVEDTGDNVIAKSMQLIA